MAYNDIKFAVSLYSYQDNLYFKRLDFEGVIAAAAGSGAEGIEVLADTMIPGWPYITDEFADRFVGLQERYGVKGVCFEHWSDRAMWKNKLITDDQMFQRGVMYIKAAAKLGIPMVKLLHEEHTGPKAFVVPLTTYPIIERLLPVAADLGVSLVLEVHTADGVGADYQQKYVELAARTGGPLYLCPDFSTFSYCMTTADIVDFTSRGAQKDILLFYREKQRVASFAVERFDFESIREEFEKMNPNDVTRQSIEFSARMIGRKPPFEKLFKDLQDFAPILGYAHGKFYDLDENDCPDDMDYPRIFKALKDGGYKGYIASEFEGNRRMNMAGWVDEVEYVRRHQAYMRSLL